jgi:hypothetical protein
LSRDAVYEVIAETDGPGTFWRVILRTTDEAHAEATVEQFREAGVPVRIELFKPRPKKRRLN